MRRLASSLVSWPLPRGVTAGILANQECAAPRERRPPLILDTVMVEVSRRADGIAFGTLFSHDDAFTTAY